MDSKNNNITYCFAEVINSMDITTATASHNYIQPDTARHDLILAWH